MPSPQWINKKAMPQVFTPMSTRQFREPLLPGTRVLSASTRNVEIIQQTWESGFYHLGCRLLKFFKKHFLGVKEQQEGFRLEAVLSGELSITGSQGQRVILLQGQYHVTNTQQYSIDTEKNAACCYFVSYYPPELIKDFGFEKELNPSPPRHMPERMIGIIQEALHHPHTGIIKDLYYRRLVADLLYTHLTTEKKLLPPELSEADIAAVHQADAILSKDLSEHYSIAQLSGMAGTNAFKLKKGFRLIFKMGVFGRLIYRRMEQAKLLLETTSKPVKEVALESGYETVAGFITASWEENPLENI